MRALALKALGQEPETPRNQGPKISFETSNMITSKLKEKLAKTRRGVATKKHFEKQDKQIIPSSIFPTLTSLEQINDRYYHQIGDGFSEKIYENDPIQQRARDGIKIIKKKMVGNSPGDDLQNQANTIIKKMNAQYSYLSLDVNQQIANEHKDEKLTMKISDPDSVLHIANYMQNKEFNQVTELAVVDESQILRINARDGLTFFRIHHELNEISRKKENFEKMKEKYFDQRNPKELIEYDKELDRFDETNHQEKKNNQVAGLKNGSYTEKEKDFINTAVLKITSKKDKSEKNFMRDFLNGLNDVKEQNKKIEDERRLFYN